METTDFAKYLSAILSEYLPGERNYSPNTILAYKDTFVQLITFLKERKNIAVQDLTLDIYNAAIKLILIDLYVVKQP
jgi:hypothetical protein